MSKFKDGVGIEREIKLDVGLIEDVIAKHGIEFDTLFVEKPGDVMLLIYGKPRVFTPILADLCRLTGDDAKTFARGLNAEAMEAGRKAFLEDLALFFLPPGTRGAFLKSIEEAGTNFDQSAGSAKATESGAASSA